MNEKNPKQKQIQIRQITGFKEIDGTSGANRIKNLLVLIAQPKSIGLPRFFLLL